MLFTNLPCVSVWKMRRRQVQNKYKHFYFSGLDAILHVFPYSEIYQQVDLLPLNPEQPTLVFSIESNNKK